MSEKLRWGIIGPGGIAGAFATGLKHCHTGVLAAVASRSQERAAAFAEKWGNPTAYGSYEELLKDPNIDAVYVATPHPMHAEWAIASAEAGKHVLCEKPIGINQYEAQAIIEAAIRNDVFLMEAYMYRCHPQIAKMLELIRDGAIGEVRTIHATFAFNAGFSPESRLFSNDLAGGGILDVGGYTTSFARLVAGAALGKGFAEPVKLHALGHLCETGADGWTSAILKFPNDIIAEIATGVQLSRKNDAHVFGSKGRIVVPCPWIANGDGPGEMELYLCAEGKEPEKIVVETDRSPYAMEADIAAQYLGARQAESPAMSWKDTLGNMIVLDAWRREIDLVYERERSVNMTQQISKRPLKVRPGNNMKYAKMPGLDREVARVVMGADKGMPGQVFALCDEYIERGGNIFDTARVYGSAEGVLGSWIANRGIRKDIMILGKGAHSPYCYPDNLTSELEYSLNELQTDYLDIYMMHRDNLEVPVGEFIDVLNEHVRAGRIRVFGGSNWTRDRIEEANEYARSKDVQGFSAISNNFSLAHMLDAPWEGCLTSSGDDMRAWHESTGTPLFAWASQAQGFLVKGRCEPDGPPEDEMLARCWYSDENYERKKRAYELGKKKGISGLNISLAYVLCQPFPTFPLIGPCALEELRTSLVALDIELTPEEMAWLDLRD